MILAAGVLPPCVKSKARMPPLTLVAPVYVLAPAASPVRVVVPPPVLVMPKVAPDNMPSKVSEAPVTAFTVCVPFKIMARLMVSGFKEVSATPPVVVMELPLRM